MLHIPRLHSTWTRTRQWWSGLSLPRRIAYPAGLLLVALSTLTSSSPLVVLLRYWELFNFLFLMRLAVWVLFNPRVLFRVRSSLVRWSFAVASLLTLLLHAFITRLVTRYTELEVPGGLLFFLWLLLSLPVTFVSALACSTLGAAIGGLVTRGRPQHLAAARIGVMGIWLTLLVVLAGIRLGVWLGLNALVIEALITGLPVLALWLVPAARHLESETVSQWLTRGLYRWWVWRVGGSGRSRRLDLRPVACALAGFALAGVLAGGGLLAGLRASAQIWLISQRHGLGRINVALNEKVDRGTTHRLVLLEWDNSARRQACVESSESAVEAALIRRLNEYGVLRMVLPTPTLGLRSGSSRLAGRALFLGPAEVANNVRDLAQLESVLRGNTNVILALPPRKRTTNENPGLEEAISAFEEGLGTERPPNAATNAPDWQARLAAAARQVGSDEVVTFHAAALPVIPLRGDPEDPLPVPLLVAAALQGTAAPQVQMLSHRQALIDGKTNALIDNGSLLVDFNANGRELGFPRIPVSAVLDGSLIYAADQTGAHAWVNSATFLKDKVVFLEPLVPHPHATPVGEMSRMEILAYATKTILGGTGLLRPPTWKLVGWSLLCAVLVGVACARTGLTAGVWRLLTILMTVSGVTVVAFFGGTWLDPVLPVTASVATFVLVLQLSLTLERQAKNQNRSVLQRFVAPEIVQKMLEDPAGRLTLGGQREPVAILFADVRGFSRFAEAHSPEEVIKVVNAYLQVMTDALNQYGGMLDKYTGDGLMALFRLQDLGDAAVINAVQAALAMRDATLRLSSNRDAGGDKSLQVGIALHVGEVVVGLVGNATRQVGFTALGHAVVVAARLQTLALGGEAIISEEVQRAVGDLFELEPRAAVSVKGLSAPLACYRVLCVKPARLIPGAS